MTDRYNGKPFLRILELYVLDAIHELSKADREQVDSLTPHLNAIYGVDGSWIDVVEQVMQIPSNAKEAIRALWQGQMIIAAKSGNKLSPQGFAEYIVNTQFDCN